MDIVASACACDMYSVITAPMAKEDSRGMTYNGDVVAATIEGIRLVLACVWVGE